MAQITAVTDGANAGSIILKNFGAPVHSDVRDGRPGLVIDGEFHPYPGAFNPNATADGLREALKH